MDIIRRIGVTLVVVISLLAACRLAAAVEGDLTVTEGRSTLTLAAGNQPVVEYRHKDVPYKPYVARLYSPNGAQILLDSPADHKHHHALMFALAVDGVDFWSETPGCGSQKSRLIRPLNTGELGDNVSGGFIEELNWTEPKQGKTLLSERRTIEVVSRPTVRPVTLVTWRTRLSTPPLRDSAKLTGSHYFGLGMRFVKSMDVGGRFFNFEGVSGEVVRGTERLTATPWCAYTAPVDGKPVTVALFDHPSNPRHPNKMFTMTRPFAYLSATLNLWKEPMEVKAARPLELGYGVAVWDGAIEAKEIDTIYESWASSTALRHPGKE